MTHVIVVMAMSIKVIFFSLPFVSVNNDARLVIIPMLNKQIIIISSAVIMV